MEAFLKSHEMGKPKKLVNLPNQRYFKIAAASLFSILGIKQVLAYRSDKANIELKKERLRMPVY